MAITYSYPLAAPAIKDTLVGTKFIDGQPPTTNSFNIGELADLIAADILASPISIGTANGLSLAGNVLSLGLSTPISTGALNSTDWNTFNNKQNRLAGTGLVKSTAGVITYLTDSTANWNTSYNNMIVSAIVTGTTTKMLSLTQQDGGIISASWSDGGGSSITLTTTGTSGPATLIDNVLNIPQYSGGGGDAVWGGITGMLSSQTDLQNALDAKANDNAVVKLTGTQTIDGIKEFLSAVRGTSLQLQGAGGGSAVLHLKTGNSYSPVGDGYTSLYSMGQYSLTMGSRYYNNSLGSSITKKATLSLNGITDGEERVFTFPDKTGTFAMTSDIPAAITLTTTGTSGAATLTGSVLNIPQYAGGVISFNTRTGAITLSSADVTTALGFTPYNSTNPSGYMTAASVNTLTNKSGNISQWTNNAGYLTGITSGQVTGALGYTPYNSTNPNGYISGINSSAVTTALGYTPYNSTNPNGYTTNTGTVTSVSGTGSVSGLSLSGTVTGSGSLTLSGTLSLTSGQVTGALGYTPYNSTNPNGYITSSALSAYLPLTGGYVSGSITAAGGFFNSDLRLKDIISRDGEVVIFKWKDGRDDKTHIGYIAQEVQEIFPDTVKEGEDGMLSVNYTEVLVAKIAELEKRIKQLEHGME